MFLFVNFWSWRSLFRLQNWKCLFQVLSFSTFNLLYFQAEGLTAIECWVIACIIFVFGALLEYTVILLKLKLKKVRAEKFLNGSMQNGGSGSSRKKRVHGSINRPDRFSRTDLIFLCVFPVLFIVFNLCYWTAIYWWRWHNWTRVQGFL